VGKLSDATCKVQMTTREIKLIIHTVLCNFKRQLDIAETEIY